MLKTYPIPTAKNEEAQIRQAIDEFTQALRFKNIEKIMLLYAPDVVSFDIQPPLLSVGAEAYRKKWQEAFAGVDGPFGFEVREPRIIVSGEMAYVYSLNHVNLTLKEGGKKVDMWLRWSSCFRKVDGRWIVTHEHISVPTDMETGQAMVNLKPLPLSGAW